MQLKLEEESHEAPGPSASPDADSAPAPSPARRLGASVSRRLSFAARAPAAAGPLPEYAPVQLL